MDNIRMYNLNRTYFNNKKAFDKAFEEVCSASAFSDGIFVKKFEREFADYIGVKSAGAVNSGTDALFLALKSLNIGKGDEVIVPSATFTATPGAVSMTGAMPVFADCEADTWEISPDDVMKRVTKNTKAVIGVHLYGNLFDVDAFDAFYNQTGIPYIEDCAQAAGTEYKGKKAGSFGKLGCFSFYPTKNLGAFGEGGAVVGDTEELISRVSFLKKHAKTDNSDHSELGYNMRMDGIQGAMLSVLLKDFPKFMKRKESIASIYLDALKDNFCLQTQKIRPGVRHAYHLFVVLPQNREKFMRYMLDNGIETAIQYEIPCHMQKVYKSENLNNRLENTETLFSRCVSVPSHPTLTDEEVERVADAIKKYSE